MLKSLAKAHYFFVLTDGSNNIGVTEKEMTCIRCVDPESGEVQCNFLSLGDIKDATAAGLKDGMAESFNALGLEDFMGRLTAMCTDGAAVNVGVNKGLGSHFFERKCPGLLEYTVSTIV